MRCQDQEWNFVHKEDVRDEGNIYVIGQKGLWDFHVISVYPFRFFLHGFPPDVGKVRTKDLVSVSDIVMGNWTVF
jgi:hypothetical protein